MHVTSKLNAHEVNNLNRSIKTNKWKQSLKKISQLLKNSQDQMDSEQKSTRPSEKTNALQIIP